MIARYVLRSRAQMPGGNVRPRYYIDFDGRVPRTGSKRDAASFDAQTAEAVQKQLAALGHHFDMVPA